MKVNVGCNSLTMSELAEICGGVLTFVGGELERDLPFNYVCTDSRETDDGTLFVALGGEKVDGHDYIGAAVSSGLDKSRWRACKGLRPQNKPPQGRYHRKRR